MFQVYLRMRKNAFCRSFTALIGVLVFARTPASPALPLVLNPPFHPDRVVSSTHFKVYHESFYAPAGVLNVLEGLYAKLMLDLHAFVPADMEKIPLFLYKSPESYGVGTGAPLWAGAHVNLETRTVYAYESDQFQRFLAHEMAHLFFDRFFSSETPTPLWLNEGVAMVMERDYGLKREDRAIAQQFQGMGVLPLSQFFHYSYRHVGPVGGQEVSLWYSQAYSLTKFLMYRFSNAQFVTFCRAVRVGKSVDEALLAGYGLQMSNTATLERLWREDLETK